MQIFDYVVFYIPNEEDKKDSKPEIIKEGRILKKDQKQAQIEVTRLIDEKWNDKMEDIQIAIRSF